MPKAKKTAEKRDDQRTTSLASSRIEKYYNKIVIVFVGLTVILVALIGYFSFAKTVVTITPKTIEMDISIESSLKELGGSVLLTDVEGTKAMSNIQTSEARPGKATGTVTLVNKYSQNQPLVETTRLLSKEGVLFRTQETVTVPAGGSVDVAVIADQEGKGGDIGPSTFEIVALWEGLKDAIYGTSSEPMSGGVTSVGIISDTDVKTVKSDLYKTLITQAKKQFTEAVSAQASEGSTAYSDEPLLLATGKDIVDPAIGTQGSAVTATQQLTFGIPVLDDAKLDTVVQEKIAGEIPAGFQAAQEGTLSIRLDSVSEENTNGAVTIDVRIQLLIEASNPLFDTKKLTNKTAGDITTYLKDFEEVERVEVRFSPFWVKRSPALADHIVIRFAE